MIIIIDGVQAMREGKGRDCQWRVCRVCGNGYSVCVCSRAFVALLLARARVEGVRVVKVRV